MSLINWGAVTPDNSQGPAREVASINGLLSALAERRVKAQQQAEAQDFQEREFAARTANQQVDNARADQDLQMRTEYNRAQLEQTKANQNAIRAENRQRHKTLTMQAAFDLQGKGLDEQADALWAQHLAAYPESAGEEGTPVTSGRTGATTTAGGAATSAAGSAAAGGSPAATAPSPSDIDPGFVDSLPGAAPSLQPPPLVPQSPGVFPGAAPSPQPSPGMPPAPAQGMGPGTSNPAVGGSTPPGGAPMATPRMPVSSHVLPPMDHAAIASRRAAQLAPFEALVKQDPELYGSAFEELKANVLTGAMPLPQAQKIFIGRVQFKQAEAGRMTRNANTNAVSGGKGPTPLKKALDEDEKYRISVQSALSLKKYGEVVHNERKLAELAAAASGGNDNPALAAIVKGAFVKYAQGGTGVVSDQDMKVFWDSIGGLPVRTWEMVQNAYDGNMGPQKQAMVKSAIGRMLQTSQANMNDAGQTVVAALERMPDGARHIPGFLKEFAPRYLPTWARSRAKRDAPSTDTSDEEFLKQHGGP